jgi:nucleotide-binding universal stress UspA family protein
MILCPVDFSPATAALICVAANLARAEADAALTLLHVAPTGQPAEARQAAAAQLVALRDHPALAGLTGCPAPVITEQAAILGASTVVLGAHGAGGLTRFLMGSTAEAVLRTAPCPTVLLTLPSSR